MTEKTVNADVEKQDKEKDDDELEKVKENKPRMYFVCFLIFYFCVFCFSAGLNASLVAFYTVSSSMFIIGWINLNSCPINIMIPIYLIVAGD